MLFQNIGMKLFSNETDDFYSDFGLTDVVSFAMHVCQVDFQSAENLPG